MERILIVNVNWIGDVVLSTPFIRMLRNSFPQAYIACMVVPRCKDILTYNPNLNELIVFDEKGAHKGLFGKIRMIKTLKQKNFSTVYFLHRSLTRTLLAVMAKIPERIGFSSPKRNLFLTRVIPAPDISTLHRADYYLQLGKALGMKPDDKGCDFYITEEDKNKVNDLLNKHKIGTSDKFIIINPGGNWPNKRWAKELYAKLCRLIAKNTNYKIVITGAEKDILLGDEIKRMASVEIFNFAGAGNLKFLAALLERASLIITNDTGPLHIACSLEKNLICIFGPTSPKLTGPYRKSGYTAVLQKDVGCKIPCYNTRCTNFKCMQAVSAGEVFEQVKKCLKMTGRVIK